MINGMKSVVGVFNKENEQVNEKDIRT